MSHATDTAPHPPRTRGGARDVDPAPPQNQEEQPPAPEAFLLEEDLLIEEVSIDGMCGVY